MDPASLEHLFVAKMNGLSVPCTQISTEFRSVLCFLFQAYLLFQTEVVFTS